MFSIKCQEIVDKNTGVHLAFGDYGKDKSTVWVRITRPAEGNALSMVPQRITTVTLHRDGDVINIMPVEAVKPVEQKGHFTPQTPTDRDAALAARKIAEDKSRGSTVATSGTVSTGLPPKP